jgi:hypothetical protein
MGSFVYDRCPAVEIDDRALAHLQTVILDKLRRNESFAFDVFESKRWVTFWVCQRTPLEFRYGGQAGRPSIVSGWNYSQMKSECTAYSGWCPSPSRSRPGHRTSGRQHEYQHPSD